MPINATGHSLSLTTMNVKLTKTQRILVESSGDIARIMQQILLRENRVSRKREHLWTVGLSKELSILYVELVGLGTSTKNAVEPMEVFKLALQKDASHLYLCHNRPNDDMSARSQDKALTDRLIQVGNIVGINVYDHVIINSKSEDYLSFADVGIMGELRKSTAWVPPYQQIKAIKKMVKEQAISENTRKLAKQMKKNKLDADTISRITGLTLGEIEKL